MLQICQKLYRIVSKRPKMSQNVQPRLIIVLIDFIICFAHHSFYGDANTINLLDIYVCNNMGKLSYVRKEVFFTHSAYMIVSNSAE